MAPPFRDRAHLAPDERTALEHAHVPLTTLGAVLDWARAQSPPLAVAEIVTQDEYTHDVILDFTAGRCLVYDTT